MTVSIYRYQPVITTGPNGVDLRPTSQNDAAQLLDLAELEGWRYVSVPDAVTPLVPSELITWQLVVLTSELRTAIKAASPHCQLAQERLIATIRAKHSLDDEMYYARIAVGTLMGTYTLQEGEAELLATYQSDVEAARVVLHNRYAELGL